jgi:hypothetical protein
MEPLASVVASFHSITTIVRKCQHPSETEDTDEAYDILECSGKSFTPIIKNLSFVILKATSNVQITDARK